MITFNSISKTFILNIPILLPCRRPLEKPKPRPDEITPLMAAISRKDPQMFIAQNITTAEQRRNTNKRAADALPPVSPAPVAPNGVPGTGVTPNTDSAERTKRARTSLKLSIAAAEKATLAPTLAEEAAATAQDLVLALSTFCRRHPDLLQEDGEDADGNATNGEATDDEATQLDAAPDGLSKGSSPSHVLLADIRRVVNTIVKASAVGGVMQQVPREILAKTLHALRNAADRGKHTLLKEGDQESDQQVATALAGMEAAVAALRLSVAALGSINHIVPEEVLEAAIEVTRFQLQHNVLPFHDARLRAATRSDLSAATEDIADEIAGDDDGAGPSKPSSAAKAKAQGRGKGAGAGKRKGGKNTTKLGLE